MYFKHYTTIVTLLLLFVNTFINAGLFKQITEEETVPIGYQRIKEKLALPDSGLTFSNDMISIKLSGYVSGEAIYDTHQVIGVRDDQVLLYPEPVRRDIFGENINHRGQFDEFAIETRYNVELLGPKIDGAKTRIVVEGDFFGRLEVFPEGINNTIGQGNDVINTFRLRHAFLDVSWPNFTFLAGQNWIPLEFPIESPGCISFNAGVPIEAFGRNPQLRCVYHNDSIELMAVALGSVDAFNDGPSGGNTTYQRNSLMPEFNLSSKYSFDDGKYFVGGVGSVRRIIPQLATFQDIRTRESLTSWAIAGYAKATFDPFLFYAKIIWGQNVGPYYAMIGGYAVDSYDPLSGIQSYTPLRTLSAWLECIINPKNTIEPACFIGVTKGLGASKCIFPTLEHPNGTTTRGIFGLGTNIDYVFRISPRIKYYKLPFVLGFEYEYTRAAFGTVDNYGKVQNAVPSDNSRFLLACFYIF